MWENTMSLYWVLNKMISKYNFPVWQYFPLPYFFQEQEEGNDQANVTFEIEEPDEPTPTTGQRILASWTTFKTRLADLFVHFVILPNSRLRLIKYINCLFVFATTLTITYMVSI